MLAKHASYLSQNMRTSTEDKDNEGPQHVI